MLIPNNPWSTTWSSALPVPAHRQKRLFDDTREAEKALHFLSTKRIGQIAQLLLPALTHAALYTLSEQKQDALPNLPDVTISILNKLQYATKPIHQKLHVYEVSLSYIVIDLHFTFYIMQYDTSCIIISNEKCCRTRFDGFKGDITVLAFLSS